MPDRAPRTRSAVSNGSRMFLGKLNGNSAEARRFRDIIEDLWQERGGHDALSVTQREACRTYAGLILMRDRLQTEEASGKPVDDERLGQIGDRLARAARDMGKPKPPAKLTPRQHAEQVRAAKGTP